MRINPTTSFAFEQTRQSSPRSERHQPGSPPQIQERVDRAVGSASKRRWIGRYLHRVGDDYPWSTAVVAALISPVLAVLLARMVHPTQRLVRTSVVAVLAYGLGFALFYSGLGASAAAVI